MAICTGTTAMPTVMGTGTGVATGTTSTAAGQRGTSAVG
jgi:hypothetical protein